MSDGGGGGGSVGGGVVPRLLIRGVTKAFGATPALAGVDFALRPGEVHALLGENGAGKSTLMRCVGGAHRPDAGSMELDGAPFAPDSPLAARDAGVAMIYQELTLAPHLSVAANVALGREPATRLGWLRRGAMRARAAQALALLDVDVPPGARVADLGPAPRQIVEIARALAHRARVLVMDEPTSSLGAADAARLFTVVRRLAASGVGVIYISHFLEEVRRVADRFTVLRDGRSVGTGEVAATTDDQLVELKAGQALRRAFPGRERRGPGPGGQVVLRARGLAGARRPVHADLDLRRGEILGLAGLVGAGRTELLRCLFGLDLPLRAGTVQVGGTTDRGASPPARLAQGVGMLSEDRKREGLLLNRSIAENVALGRMQPFSRWGWFRPAARQSAVQPWLERLGVRARSTVQRAAELSGGNQQKVAFARLLHSGVDVLLLDEPTRGIDVRSRGEIHRLIADQAAAGKAVLLVSSYLPELLGLCDRVAVMHRGRLGPARAVEEWSEEALLAAAASGEGTA